MSKQQEEQEVVEPEIRAPRWIPTMPTGVTGEMEIHALGPDGKSVCVAVVNKALPGWERLANTWLLAAAPDLLEALEDCVARISSDIGSRAPEVIKARVVIARAKAGAPEKEGA